MWILIRDRGPAPGQSLLCLPAPARLLPSTERPWGARTVAGTRSLPRLPTLQTSPGKAGPASPAASGLRWRKYEGTSGWGPKWLLNLGAETTPSPLRLRWSDRTLPRRSGGILRPAPGSPGKVPLGELPGAGRRQLSRQVSSVWLSGTTGVLRGSREKRNFPNAALSGDALCDWWVVSTTNPRV